MGQGSSPKYGIGLPPKNNKKFQNDPTLVKGQGLKTYRTPPGGQKCVKFSSILVGKKEPYTPPPVKKWVKSEKNIFLFWISKPHVMMLLW